MDYMRALKILKSRRKAVIAVALIAFCLIAVAPKPEVKVDPMYTSKAKILITPPSSSVRAYGGQSVSSTADFSWFADPTVLTELLRSEELLSRVIKQTNASVSQEELAYSIAVAPLSENRYGRNIRLFSLSVVNRDPKEAQKLTRLLTEEFVRYVEDLSAREFSSTRRFIEELVLEAEGQKETAEISLMGVREKYLGSESDDQIMMQARSLEGRINELERGISSTQVDVQSLREYIDGAAGTPPWQVISANSGTLNQLEANVAEKKLELARVADIYTDSSEKVQDARRQLSKAEGLYETSLNEIVSSLHKTKSSELTQRRGERSSLSAELNRLLGRRMNDEDRRLIKKHESALQVWEQNHLNLQQQLYQARVIEQSSRRQGAVNVLEQPGVGTVAYDPDAPVLQGQSALKRNILAIPFCIILGMAAAFVHEYLVGNTKLRPRIEETLEVPVIAVIPMSSSEIVVDWEGFKRPGREELQPMLLGSRQATGTDSKFANRRSKVPVAPSAPETSQGDVTPGSFGDNFKYRNQK